MHFAGKSYTLSLQNKKEGAGMAKQPKKLIANNKKVYHDYFLEETFEAGIALAGTEVKSMRDVVRLRFHPGFPILYPY